MKIVFRIFLAFTCVSSIGIAGGIGGGTPPSLQIEAIELMSLREGAINGDAIRLTMPGAESVYMLPDTSSIRPQSLRANSVDAKSTTLFYAKNPVAEAQTSLALSLAKSLKLTMTPAILPVDSSEIVPVLKPKVELVPASELQVDTTSNETN